MTAASNPDLVEIIAEHLGARRTGVGRWIAHCPAHPDRSPSLSIAAGRDGKVLVRCWVGCDLTTVLKSAGLSVSSLFPSGPPPTPEQCSRLERKRERQLVAQQEERYTVKKNAIALASSRSRTASGGAKVDVDSG